MSDLFKSFIAGWIGGLGNLVVGHPFDTVKTLMQNSSKDHTHRSSLEIVTRLVKEEGPLAVYKGVFAPLIGVGVVFALYFLAFDMTEHLIRIVKAMDKKQQLSMFDVLICGAATGFFGSIILGPAELIKIRQQTAYNLGFDGSFNAVVKHIWKNYGFIGFYRGFGATCIRDIPGSMAWFGGYELTKRLLCEDPKNPGVAQALLAGGIGGLSMWSFAIPLDAIKTKVQASHEHISVGNAIRSIAKEKGLRGFYRGIVPALLRAFPANAATFASRDYARSALDKLL